MNAMNVCDALLHMSSSGGSVENTHLSDMLEFCSSITCRHLTCLSMTRLSLISSVDCTTKDSGNSSCAASAACWFGYLDSFGANCNFEHKCQ
jgi:hypothetical protein